MQYVFDAGIHSLTAFYDFVHRQLSEHSGNAFACAYGNHTDRLLVSLARLDESTVLFKHVFDLYLVQFTQLQRIIKSAVGSIGMDVHLDEIYIADNDNAIADRHQFVAKLFDIFVRDVFFKIDYKIFRTISVLDIVEVVLVVSDGVELRKHSLMFFFSAFGLSDLNARKRLVKALENV